MATVIDALVVSVGLDPSKFKTDSEMVNALLKRLRDNANTTAKEMEASGKQAAQFFAQAKIEALGLIGTLVGAGGMLAFTKNATQSLADLGRSALNIGVAIPQLNAFQNVIERNGGSAESATASMKGLVDQIERFKVFGDPSVFKFLNPIGANINDTPLAIWQKFVEFADKHRNDPALVNLIGHGLGFDQGLINASLQIRGAADAARQLADEVQRVATPEMVQNATELQKAWEDLQHQAVFTGEAVLNNLSPALRSILVWGKDEIAQNPALIEGLTAVVGALVSLGAIRISAGLMGLTGLSTAIGALVGFMERLAPYAALLLSLHGDTPTHEDDQSPGPGGEVFGEHGGLSRWWEHNMPSWLGGGPRAPESVTTDLTMTPEKRAFLDTIATGEGADYNVLNGGERFTDMSQHPNRVGRGGTSTAAGRYQFIKSTWDEEKQRLGLPDFSSQSQDKAAWDLASRTYTQNTHRDLAADLKSGGHETDIAAALKSVWPSLPGGSQQTTSPQQFQDRLKANNEREKQLDLDRQKTPNPQLPNPPLSGPNRIPGTAPIQPPVPPVPAAPGQQGPPGPPGAVPPVPPAPPAPSAAPLIRLDPALVPQPGASVSNVSTSSTSTSMHIGSIHVATQATDAKGIAGDMRDAVSDAFVQQANRGLT